MTLERPDFPMFEGLDKQMEISYSSEYETSAHTPRST